MSDGAEFSSFFSTGMRPSDDPQCGQPAKTVEMGCTQIGHRKKALEWKREDLVARGLK